MRHRALPSLEIRVGLRPAARVVACQASPDRLLDGAADGAETVGRHGDLARIGRRQERGHGSAEHGLAGPQRPSRRGSSRASHRRDRATVPVSSGPDTSATSRPSISIERREDPSSSPVMPPSVTTNPACTPLARDELRGRGSPLPIGKMVQFDDREHALDGGQHGIPVRLRGKLHPEPDGQLALERQLQVALPRQGHSGRPALALEEPGEDRAVDPHATLRGGRRATDLVADHGLAPPLAQPGHRGLDRVSLFRVGDDRGGIGLPPVENAADGARPRSRCPWADYGAACRTRR